MAHFYLNGIKCVATQPERIKILYTIPNFDTAGSGKALLNIVMRLNSEKFEPHILCMHERGVFFQEIRNSGIPVHVFTYTAPMRPYWIGLRECWKISRKLKGIGADIIHSFHYAADYSEALAAWLAGIRWVYTKKNMNWGGSSGNGWRLRTWLAWRVIAQNSEMLNQFFPDSRKTVLIPRGLDVNAFASIERVAAEDNRLRVLTVANLAPVKRLETVLKAMRNLQAKNLHVTFHIVGDSETEYGKQLKGRVSSMDLVDSVIFHGKQPSTNVFYGNADVFVLPSLKESSPVALLEAMAAGVPVLASRTAGALEIMGDFEEQLFLVDDADSLAERLQWIFALPQDEKAQLINRQLERVRTRHDIALEVSRHEQLYQHVS